MNFEVDTEVKQRFDKMLSRSITLNFGWGNRDQYLDLTPLIENTRLGTLYKTYTGNAFRARKSMVKDRLRACGLLEYFEIGEEDTTNNYDYGATFTNVKCVAKYTKYYNNLIMLPNIDVVYKRQQAEAKKSVAVPKKKKPVIIIDYDSEEEEEVRIVIKKKKPVIIDDSEEEDY